MSGYTEIALLQYELAKLHTRVAELEERRCEVCGNSAEAKESYHNTLLELAEETRAMLDDAPTIAEHVPLQPAGPEDQALYAAIAENYTSQQPASPAAPLEKP